MKKFIAAAFILCMGIALLAGCGGGSGKDSDSTVAGDPATMYRVIVKDESGAGVQGVMIQFCSDTTCVMGETDGDGIAKFEDQEEGSYTIHVYSVPDGYAEDAEEYTAPETYGDVNITLKEMKVE